MENNYFIETKKQCFSDLEPNATRPVWADQKMTCDTCNYNDQDVDTFPCAKCHTRMQ